MYIQCGVPILKSKPFWTLTIDLRQDADAIFKGFKSSLRNEINKTIKKDGLIIHINSTPTVDDIASFSSFYDDFAAQRGIKKCNIPKLEAFRGAGQLIIGSARGGPENRTLAMFSEISDGHRVRSYYAGTAPRVGNERADIRLIGRASKLLRWRMILFLKHEGRNTYDFGGISRRQELEGVDEFKQSFGGVEVEEHNAIVGVSTLGRTALKISGLLNRLTFHTF